MKNFIKVYDNVLDNEFCEALIEEFEHSSYTIQGTTTGGVDLSKKNSTDLQLFRYREYSAYHGTIMQKAHEKFVEYFREFHFMIISAFSLTLYHPQTMEPTLLTDENFDEVALPQIDMIFDNIFTIQPPQMQKYAKGVGGYPYWHSETYPNLPSDEALHRVLLYIFYLNDVDEGGETEFFYQNVKQRPKRGSMVIAPCYFTHTHRGNMPISDDKYILTAWLNFKSAKSLYKQR